MDPERIARMDGNTARAVGKAGQDVRYVPQEGRLDFVGVAHETRYLWTVDHLPLEGAAVLDLGCGSGYGAFLLAQKAASVHGIDSCAEAIAFAQGLYVRPNLRYWRANACSRELFQAEGPRTYDILVSFDVIEHIERYFDYLENASQLLKENGRFLLSTPNRLQTFNWNSQWNPCHLQEFTPYQLRKILDLYFAKVTLMAQDFRDKAKREALQSEAARRKAMKELGPLARMSRKIGRHILDAGQGARRRRPTLNYSDIQFLPEPGDEVLAQAFGLMALCEQPRDARQGPGATS